MKRLAVALTITILLAALVSAGCAQAYAGQLPRADRRLMAAHHCRLLSADGTLPQHAAPVQGYLVGLHSQPAVPWFYVRSDSLTSGLLYGGPVVGGDWVLEAWCRS